MDTTRTTLISVEETISIVSHITPHGHNVPCRCGLTAHGARPVVYRRLTSNDYASPRLARPPRPLYDAVFHRLPGARARVRGPARGRRLRRGRRWRRWRRGQPGGRGAGATARR